MAAKGEEEAGAGAAPTVVGLALSGSKSSAYVLRSALANFAKDGAPPAFKLIHVLTPVLAVPTPMGHLLPIDEVSTNVAEGQLEKLWIEKQEMLRRCKDTCDENKVEAQVLLVEGKDVADTISSLVSQYQIQFLVVGNPSSKSPFTRRSSASRTACKICKSLPSFCTAYVVSKDGLSSVYAPESESGSPSGSLVPEGNPGSSSAKEFTDGTSSRSDLDGSSGRGLPGLPSLPRSTLGSENLESSSSVGGFTLYDYLTGNAPVSNPTLIAHTTPKHSPPPPHRRSCRPARPPTPSAMSCETDSWLICKSCSLLVRSISKHYDERGHEDFRITKDGSLNLVCSECTASFRKLAEAAHHMNIKGHTDLYDTPLDDDGQVSTKLGVAPVDTSVSSWITARSKVLAVRTMEYLQVSEEDATKLRDTYVLVEDVMPDVVLQRINKLLEDCQGKEGVIVFNISNVHQKNHTYVFEEVLNQLCLVKKTLTCTSLHAKQAKKVKRLHQMLLELKNMLMQNMSTCIHQIPYTHPEVYARQRTSNSDLDEICAMLGVNRESLGVYTEPTGTIMGPVLLYIGEKLLLDCQFGGISGNKIPAEAHKVTEIKYKKPIAFILLVEKQTTFQDLAKLEFANKHNCLLISGGGQPSVGTRVMLRRLSDILEVPIYGLFDGNPAGAVMYVTYKYGSEGKAFDGICLTVPSLIWIGLFPEDVGEMHRTAISSDTQDGVFIDPRRKTLAESLEKAEKYYAHDDLLWLALSRMKLKEEVAEIDMLTNIEEHVLRKIKEAAQLEDQETSSMFNLVKSTCGRIQRKRKIADAS